MKEYLLILTSEERDALGSVRCLPNLQVAEDGNLYLRGLDEAAMADRRVKNLPVLHSYVVDAEQRLFPLKGLTPVGKLKPLKWTAINQFINIELPISALPVKGVSKVAVRLKVSDASREGWAILTDLATWKTYAETAPAIRLGHLKFAVASNGETLIIGTPLPPIKGKEFYKENDIVLPAGYAFEVPLAAYILQQQLNADGQGLLLFSALGEWHKIPLSSFVPASRAAIRLTSINEEK